MRVLAHLNGRFSASNFSTVSFEREYVIRTPFGLMRSTREIRFKEQSLTGFKAPVAENGSLSVTAGTGVLATQERDT